MRLNLEKSRERGYGLALKIGGEITDNVREERRRARDAMENDRGLCGVVEFSLR